MKPTVTPTMKTLATMGLGAVGGLLAVILPLCVVVGAVVAPLLKRTS